MIEVEDNDVEIQEDGEGLDLETKLMKISRSPYMLFLIQKETSIPRLSV